MGGAVEQVGDFIQDEIIDPVKEVGRDVDSFVRDEIPGGWLTVGAATGAGLLGSGALGGATAAEGAAAAGATEAAAGAGLSSAAVPSAFDAAVGSALGGGAELGSFGSLGTAGYGSALAPASEVAAGLAAGGFAPGTAANLAGLTAAGTGATNLLGGATAFAPISPAAASFGVKQAVDALRAGNSIRGMLGQPEPQIPNMIGRNQMPQGSVDYSQYLNLLAQRPRRADITSLLG
jgi:hypothetical protein